MSDCCLHRVLEGVWRNALVVYPLSISPTSMFNVFVLASNKNDGLTFKLALPPKYKATWWRTQRYENGTLGNKTRFSSPMFRNYTQFIENSYLAQIITYSGSPQSIQVIYISFSL